MSAPAAERRAAAGRAVDHDVLVVGGGHNGLTCAAYLARAGFDVCVLEARATVGGCASSEEVLGGARVNICNCDHALVRATGIVEDLDLAAHGLHYLDLEPAQLAIPWGEEEPWVVFADAERTVQSIAHAHPREVDGYRRYLADLVPAARLVLAMGRAAPTPRGVGRGLRSTRAEGLRAVLRLSRSSVADVLRSYFTSEALLGPAAVTGPAVWGLPPQTPGTGLGALNYAFRHAIPVGRPRGGSGALTDALASVVTSHGGRIRTGARVAAITCGGGGAEGVRLADGRRLSARVVVSAADPRATFTELLDGAPASARTLVDGWRGKEQPHGYEAKLDAVVDHVPRPRRLTPEHLAEIGDPDPRAATWVVAPSLQGIADAHAVAQQGRVHDRPLFLANTPSLVDPTVAPADGGHVFSLEALFTPYRLQGGWAGTREPERWLEAFATHAEPGFLEGVRRWRLVGPEDYERDFGMPLGYAPSFAGGPLQALLGRPRELTRYATAVPGLFLTGSGTFPGAGVSGAPGRNAAAVVLKALRG